MSDTRLDKLLTLGTDADRLAFVPDPPTDVLVCWYSTDTNALYVWDGAWNLVATGGGGTGDVVGPASAVDDRIATFDGITGTLIQDGGQTIAQVLAAAPGTGVGLVGTLGCTFDGGGVALTAGAVRYVLVPYAHTITAAYMLADISGSAVVDVWRDSFANYPPVVGDSITASAKPTLTAAISSVDSTLTGWSTSGAALSIYAFSLTSVSTITVLQIQLVVART